MEGQSKQDQTLIELTGLNRSFQEGEKIHQVLQDLDAEFTKGEVVGLSGRSGSGKSTLLNIISGIDRPDKGKVLVSGMSLTDMSETDRTVFRRRNIGFVYQAFNLIPTLTVEENIRLVLELNGINDQQGDMRVEKLLNAVNLADRAGSFPDLLSGGEQQRVAIARALIHRPRIVLADEPTGNLDDRTASVVLHMLHDLVRKEGSLMIIATHSDTVAAGCDRVLSLRDGRLSD